MKYIFLITILAISFISNAQNNTDCKFKEMKFSDGSKRKAISIPTKLGRLTLSKYHDSLIVNYNTKILFQMADETHNRIYLRVDSVQLYFSDNSRMIVKSYGNGLVENKLTLKPQFESMNFSMILTARELALIKGKELMLMKMMGEKETEGADGIAEPIRKQVKDALICFSELR